MFYISHGTLKLTENIEYFFDAKNYSYVVNTQKNIHKHSLIDKEWLEKEGLKGFANRMYVQYQEELSHAQKFYRYVNEKGGVVVLEQIGAVKTKWENVTEVFKTLMATEQNPSKTEPAVSFSAEGGFGTFEIGTKRNLTYTATLSTGGYTYGPATGITAYLMLPKF